MSTVKERLSEFIRFKKISTVEFERLIGVSNGYVSSISKSIQPDKLEIISEFNPELSIEWLLIGKGSMLKSEQASSNNNNQVGGINANYQGKFNDVHTSIGTGEINIALKKENAQLKKENDTLKSEIEKLKNDLIAEKERLIRTILKE